MLAPWETTHTEGVIITVYNEEWCAFAVSDDMNPYQVLGNNQKID